MSSKLWGDRETEYFFEITPEKILEAVESAGFKVTGRCLPLNSMENRVYEVELEWESDTAPEKPSDRFRIVKFYRPGRWSENQINDEHQFLLELNAAEIPAIAPLPFEDGKTLKKVPDVNIWFSVFPKVGGRSPDELTNEQAEQVGRLLARIHQVGDSKKSQYRLPLVPATYGIANLEYLLSSNSISIDVRTEYEKTVREICRMLDPWFKETKVQRIHGDCHFGNLLFRGEEAFFIDFDDMVVGPPVQDVWLLTPGRDEYSDRLRNRLLSGYEQMREFDWDSLKLVEGLRALRLIHFSAWISKRWQDPAFQRTFIQYGTPRYWEEQLADLKDQLSWIQKESP